MDFKNLRVTMSGVESCPVFFTKFGTFNTIKGLNKSF